MVSCQSRCSANLAFAVLLMVGSTLISLSFFVFPYWVFRSVTRVCRAGVTERKTFTRPAGRSDGYDPCRRQTVQKKNERRRRIGAPLRFPAPPRMGMAGHGPLSESSRSEAEGPLSPAPWGRAGWDPAALGPAGFAKGRCPLASAHSRMSNTGFPVRRAFCCFLAGFVVCRRSGRQTCRVGLVMVRGQFRFGHRSPWMAAATMAARLHSSSIASARIAVSMARPSPIHHSM